MLAVQCKMARSALGLGVRELAKLAGVSPDTVARLERGEQLKDTTISALQSALEAAGVIFVDENGEGPGVRLRKAQGRADAHPKPQGPATEVVEQMDKAIKKDRQKR